MKSRIGFCTRCLTVILLMSSSAWGQRSGPGGRGMGPGAGPYAPRVIERVQEALRSQSLYSGEVNGLLDQATMEALGEFQKQHGLQVCGVPTPSTRRVLFQSSPTPPASQP
jgi:hypothetical protein